MRRNIIRLRAEGDKKSGCFRTRLFYNPLENVQALKALESSRNPTMPESLSG
jgi:hypothetical protein